MKSKKISRRTFNTVTAAIGTLAVTGVKLSNAAEMTTPDLAVATGPDNAKNIKAAVDAVGGIGAYVKAGQTVGILTNTIGRAPGAITSAAHIRAVVALCKEAGASEIRWLDWRTPSRLDENKLVEVTKDADIKYQHIDSKVEGHWKTVEVPRGKKLKSVRLLKAFDDVDVFLALPIIKHHGATGFTGALKFVMGITNQMDNRALFHKGGRDNLEQAIADANTVVRPPDLIIMDAMETITTRGPMGPGNIIRPQKVIVGTDKVAMDVYAAPLLGADPKNALQVKAAYELGVGEIDLGKVNVKEIVTD